MKGTTPALPPPGHDGPTPPGSSRRQNPPQAGFRHPASAPDDASHPDPPDDSPRPGPPPGGWAVDDFLCLDLPPRTELADGGLVFTGPQSVFHSVTTDLLELALRAGLPAGLRVRRQMAVVLGARSAAVPDLVVVRAEHVDDPLQLSYACEDVVLAVEVVSPGSEQRDRETKPRAYARAGIPHFWLVERDSPAGHPVVRTHELDGPAQAYVPTGVHRDQLKVDVPYPISVDLTEIDRM